MERHFMNPAHRAHLQGGGKEGEKGKPAKAGGHKPHIHIHPHHDASGNHVNTTVHVMHHDGRHEKHDHEAHDHEGIKSHIDTHYGQDHGYSGGEAGEEEGAII